MASKRSAAGHGELIIGVGWRAYINWVPVPNQPERTVPIGDSFGNLISNDLVDGQEVEIVSWRPRSRVGLLYQVRRLSDGSAWWIAAQYLRRGPQDRPPQDTAAAAADR